MFGVFACGSPAQASAGRRSSTAMNRTLRFFASAAWATRGRHSNTAHRGSDLMARTPGDVRVVLRQEAGRKQPRINLIVFVDPWLASFWPLTLLPGLLLAPARNRASRWQRPDLQRRIEAGADRPPPVH